MQPLVSIIIPTYNRAHLISETLDSVLAQTYTNWECIIVDDGSNDNTEAVIEEYVNKDPRFRFYHRPVSHKQGASGSRNYGFKMSKGDFIQWFDSDDVMNNSFLELKMNCFDLHIGTDVVFCAFGYFDNKGMQNRKSNMTFSGDILEDFVNGKIHFCPQSFMLKKKVIKDYVFNEALSRSEDVDFFFKLFSTQKTLKIKHIPKVLFTVRKHSVSISSENDNKGIRLNSHFEVHKRILTYFYNENNQKGINLFKQKCLNNIKALIKNKNFKLVFVNSIGFKYLSTYKRFLLLIVTIVYFITGRGLFMLKKI